MDDLVKREDVIKEFGRVFGDLGITLFGAGGNRLAQHIAYLIPPAERKQAEWVEHGRDLWECSNCGVIIYSETERDRRRNHRWCGRCGCRMKGAEDEDN
jgi:hypothetical protein